jgi:uncharacterized protein
MFWKRKKPEAETDMKEVVQSIAVSSMDLPNLNEGVGDEIARQVEARSYQRKAPVMDGVAMDSACSPSYQGEYGAVNLRVLGFFAGSSSFIGYSNMAIIAQHWLITKGCSMTAKDAVKKWYEISVGNGVELDAKQIKAIEAMDKKYKLKSNMVQGVHFNNVFGIRHILFKNTNPDFDYSLPFNPDSWGAGEYAGMAQIDPYWIVPEIDAQDLTDPTRIDFYEPTYWNIAGNRYHKSHFVILTGDAVSDLLKPTYRYGGISKVQQVYERVYAAERTANEAPQLVMTKRLVTRMMDLAKAQANKAGFVDALMNMVSTRDNYGVNVIGKEEKMEQQETSLTDLDNVIMNQYQIVCAIYGEPASKLLGSGHGGLGTGETDEDYNIANIEQLQGNELQQIAEAHYARLIPCEIKPRFNVEPEIELNWRPLKVMSAKEVAEVNNLNANTDSILDQLGYIDMIDGAKRLANDPTSGYTGMDIPEVNLPDHNENLGADNGDAEEDEQP